MIAELLITAALAPCRLGTLPDPDCTTGASSTTAASTICSSAYRTSPVTTRTKRGTFRHYGISRAKQRRYVIDQLVPASLGGTRTLPNVFPQSKANALRKNRLEGALRQAVCRGEIGLDKAQEIIRADWVSAYTRFFPGG